MAYTTWVLVGFVLASAYNIIGISAVSLFFTNKALFDAWPSLFGREGCIAVVLWGLAYLSVCISYRQVPYLVLLFAVEKLFYFVMYIVGNRRPLNISPSKRNTLGGGLAEAFIRAFGVGDFVFMVFFAYVGFAALFGAERP